MLAFSGVFRFWKIFFAVRFFSGSENANVHVTWVRIRGKTMLQFLRKHQKYFFIVITTTIVITFCFFGTYGTMGQKGDVPDKEIGKSVTGRPIMQQELAAICRLIETSPFDRSAGEKWGTPNFFNDGVIEKDFLSNGLGAILVSHYLKDLEPDLDSRIKKIRSCRTWVHPSAPQLGVEAVWARFSPRLLEHYREVKATGDRSIAEVFALMGQLYMEQTMLPAGSLKQFLMMQQNQMGLNPDPVLANADLSLFGFKSLEDWFGPKFIPLVGQFILNAAQIAEEKGYTVKIEEVRADLYQNIYHGIQQFSPQSQLNSEEVGHYYHSRMRGFGFDENTLLSAWKKVMLLRRLFEDGSGSVLVDPLAYEQFERYARENARVVLYQLPQEFRLRDFRSMLQLQTYLESIAADPSKVRTDLRMPNLLATVEQIEKRTPELVERECEVQWSAVSKETLARTLSVKETWDWETIEAHWDLLKKNFPELGNAGRSDTAQSRLAILGALDEKLRNRIDQFARATMIGEQPDKIRQALEVTPMETSQIGLKIKGSILPFRGVRECPELAQLLESAPLHTEAPNAAAERLECYTPDGENFYKIHVVRKSPVKRVLTFAESLQNGTLSRLLDQRLEEFWPEIRKKDISYFQQVNGQWKPFREVKDQVGKHLYADLLKLIEDSYRAHYGLLPGKEGELPLNFYSSARMLPAMKEAQKNLQLNSEWIKHSGADDIASQWLPEKTEQTVERCSEVPFSKEGMFLPDTDRWSKVNTGDGGALSFYAIHERSPFLKHPVQMVDDGHRILTNDVKRDMMMQILQRIRENRAIVLSGESG